MRHLLLIGLGGALLRYGLSGLVHQWSVTGFPWGTLAVNFTGCLVIGLLWTLAEEGYMGPSVSAFIFIGVLGAFSPAREPLGFEMDVLIRADWRSSPRARTCGPPFA